jgi:hypothetical protein
VIVDMSVGIDDFHLDSSTSGLLAIHD